MMEAQKVGIGEKHVLRQKARVPVYLFSVEDHPDECMLAAVADGHLYMDMGGSRPRKWSIGVEFFALEIFGLKKNEEHTAFLAYDFIDPSRYTSYLANQMKDLIVAYRNQKPNES